MNEKGRTKMICCRLTAEEYEKLQQLFENSSFSNREKKKYSDFLRQQLLYENNSAKINLLYFDVRKMKIELMIAMRRYEKLRNEESENNLIKVLADCTQRLEQINKNMEELISGSNGTGEHKRE